MKTASPQKGTSIAGSIEPPTAKHRDIVWEIKAKIKKQIRRFFAPIDIVFHRSHKLKQAEKEFPAVLSLNETVDLLINGASISRFGDGEFNCLRWQHSKKKQSPEWILARRLEEVLAYCATPHSPNYPNQLVIAIPPFNPVHNNPPNAYGWLGSWEYYWTKRWRFLRGKLMNRTFGNSFISRDAAFYEVSVEKFRSVWSDRDVVFVVPKNGRFFDEPRLFDNMRSVEYLFVEPTYAYRHYDTTLQRALTFDKSKLFIICAGFMATVLAFDLYHHGYQALDMGHLPNCYRQYLKEAPSPESLAKVDVRKQG